MELIHLWIGTLKEAFATADFHARYGKKLTIDIEKLFDMMSRWFYFALRFAALRFIDTFAVLLEYSYSYVVIVFNHQFTCQKILAIFALWLTLVSDLVGRNGRIDTRAGIGADVGVYI